MTVAYFKFQAKNGSNQANKDLNTTTQEVINTYKTQVEQMKEQIENYRKDMKELLGKVGHLEGTITEKDRQATELKNLLLGRNPDMDAFYKGAVPLLKRVSEYLDINKPLLNRMEKFLDKEGIK